MNVVLFSKNNELLAVPLVWEHLLGLAKLPNSISQIRKLQANILEIYSARFGYLKSTL